MHPEATASLHNAAPLPINDMDSDIVGAGVGAHSTAKKGLESPSSSASPAPMSSSSSSSSTSDEGDASASQGARSGDEDVVEPGANDEAPWPTEVCGAALRIEGRLGPLSFLHLWQSAAEEYMSADEHKAFKPTLTAQKDWALANPGA